MHLAPRRAVGALAVAAIAALAGCSSSSKSATTTTAAAATTTAAASTTAAGATSTTTAATAKLLVASDVGPTFQQRPYAPSKTPLPCTPKLQAPDVAVVPATATGTVLQSTKPELQLSEAVRTYSNATQLARAYALVTAGFTCRSVTLPVGGVSTTFTITGPTDVHTQVGADKAQQWSIASTNISIIVIAAQQGDRFVGLQFSGATNADTTGIPNPLVLAKKALTKLAS